MESIRKGQSFLYWVRGRFVARLLLVTRQAGCVTCGVVCTHRCDVMPAHDESSRDRPGGQHNTPDDYRQLAQPSYGTFSARAMTTKL